MGLSAQNNVLEKELTQEEYLRLNQSKTHINNHYIPSDLDDAIENLERLGDPAGLAKFKSATETIVREKISRTLGNWVRKNWGLEKGSRLAKYFIDLRISHPDDMVDILLISFHRSQLNRPINLDEQIAHRKSKRTEIIRSQYIKGEERIIGQ